MWSDADIQYMKQALALAEKGRYSAHPNPMVGCVVVKNKKVIGKGYHECFGGAHAEVNAFKRLGRKAQGACAYVSLEPCCHWGKTPPCTDLMIQSGVKRVVVSMKDPDPRVSGKGLRQLKRAGIKVEYGLLQGQACFLNRAFVQSFDKKRPYIVLKSAQTLDGKIASHTGASKWITGPEARAFGHKLRAQSDAVMVGGETVRQDNPALTSHSKGPDPVKCVVSCSLNIPTKAKIFKEKAPVCIVTGGFCRGRGAGLTRKRQSAIEQAGGQIIAVGYKKNGALLGQIDLKACMHELYKMGFRQVLLEGGGTLAYSMVEARLVDEVFAFVSPCLMGGKKAVTSLEGEGVIHPRLAPQLKNVDVSWQGKDLLIHGFLDC